MKRLAIFLAFILAACSITINEVRKEQEPVWQPQQAFASSALITMPTKDNSGAISCSGAAISEDLILTAGHCAVAYLELNAMGIIGDRIIISSYAPDGKTIKELGDAEILEVDEPHDLAILKLEDHGLVPVKFANTIVPHEKVYLVGSPMGFFIDIEEGMVINDKITLAPTLRDVLVISSAATGGFSGSPVFNSKGEVVGLLTNGVGEYDHLSICRSVYTIKHFFKVLGI